MPNLTKNNPGEQVVISDMSQYKNRNKLKLK